MILVTKSHGGTEPFSREKILRTCLRAGSTKEQAEKISADVEKRAYDKISSREILKMVLSTLRKENQAAASRYDLSGALLRLGPAGFGFETFFGEILFNHGYSFKTDQFVRGASGVQHEIDLVLEKDGKKFLVEAKYHNAPGIFTGLHEAMYTWARFLDISQRTKEFSGMWLVSNTKFSSDAIKYANFVGLKLVGWHYPKTESLQFLIESKKLYPITLLGNLSKDDEQRFGDAGLMLLRDVIEIPIEKLHNITHINFKKLKELKSLAGKVLSG